jgi:hypothetical protein
MWALLQSKCAASADALTAMGLADCGRAAPAERIGDLGHLLDTKEIYSYDVLSSVPLSGTTSATFQ